MARRSRSRPQMSLLAFQDIITAVTGIVIVMVLLLALELTERDSSAGDPAAVTSSDAVPLPELQAELESVQAEINRLEEVSRQAAGLAGDLAEISPTELDRVIRQLSEKQEQLKRDLRQAERTARELEQQEQENQPQQREAARLQAELEQLRRNIASLEQELEEEQAAERPLYSLPGGFQKKGWLVVVEQKQIQTAPIGREARPITFSQPDSILSLESDSVKQILNWIRTEGQSGSYFLLLVRPDGATVFDDLESELIKQKISFGFDVVGQREVLLDPQRGAAP